MKTRSSFKRFCRWANLPTGVLIALLQRSPALKIVAAVGEYVLASPAGSVLKAAFATAASLGAVNTVAGATALSTSSSSPLSATVGQAVDVTFSITGTTSVADSWTISGTVPPGLLFYNTPTATTGGVNSGTLNSDSGNAQRAGNIYLRGTPTTSGNYTISLRGHNNPNGGGEQTVLYSYEVKVAAGNTDTAPAISDHPVSQTLMPGSMAMFTVSATGTSPQYQWKKNGTNIAGATSSTLTLTNIGGADAADYTVTVTNGAGSVTSRFARLVVAAPEPGRIINMSVRSVAGINGQPLIVGMVMSGGSKQVLVRGIGPRLTELFALAGTLPDPKMELFDGTTGIQTNDNWGDNGAAATMANVFASVGAFSIPNTASKDSAFTAQVNGPRTVHVNSVTTGSGIVLVETYDTGSGNDVRLINVSARNRVGTGADVLIAGFVINGNMPKKLVIRGIGPRLESLFGVQGVLADPKLEIYDSNSTLIASNDNWADNGAGSTLEAAFSKVGAYSFGPSTKDAALYLTLPAGAYTAIVSGIGNTTGDGVVEVYDAD